MSETKKTTRYRLAFALGYTQQALFLVALKLTEWMYRQATKIDLLGASAGAEQFLGPDPWEGLQADDYDPWDGEFDDDDGDDWATGYLDDDDDEPQ